jgi:EAL and modified HD-GYP domain-containing signal transduction protein
MVKNRTQLMESILKLIEPTVDKVRVSEAYFVGILSLIETLFSRKLEDILYEMNISRGVELALIKKEGLLGEILELIIDIEKFNTEAIYKFEKRYKLEKLSIEHLAIESMKSVNKFEKAQKK